MHQEILHSVHCTKCVVFNLVQTHRQLCQFARRWEQKSKHQTSTFMVHAIQLVLGFLLYSQTSRATG